MNKSNSASKIKMKSFDDLFGTNENLEQANANGGEIREIPLASLHTFRNHPFDIMSEETGENAKKIQRYIRLAKLSDELLDFVDRKKIGFIQGVDLSYLNEEQQQWVLDIILDRNIFPNIEQSARLKASCRENMLTQEEVRNIMLPEQVLAKPRKVTFKADRLDDYFDEGYTEEKITEVIINLLDEWKKRGERA